VHSTGNGDRRCMRLHPSHSEVAYRFLPGCADDNSVFAGQMMGELGLSVMGAVRQKVRRTLRLKRDTPIGDIMLAVEFIESRASISAE
jgi:hypothetical protein